MINRVLLTPLQKFVKIEGFSGILLLLSTIIALIWANSSFGDSYTYLWDYEIGITSETFELKKPLILWINDGLMAIFFFLIGLEIKREVLIGELNTMKKLAFPLFGAVGGVIVPVALYMLLNQNPDTFKGWGIPMATDIAFSLAVLNALGKRVPLSLKIFLIAFAIVDDIEAVLVIAIFYSGTIKMTLLLIGLGLLGILYLLSYKGYYSKYILFFTGIIVWLLFLKSGVHPTVAGILLALSVPISQNIETSTFINRLEGIFKGIKNANVLKKPILSKQQIEQMDDLEGWSNKFQSPLQHLEHNLHGWVAYFIIPLFALANAGILIDSSVDIEVPLVINIILCLVLGKGLGIPSVIFLAKKLNLVQIPSDVNFKQIIGVSFIAGIGFTMAIFIASLAFASTPEYITSAKIGILLGSLISAIIGYFILRVSTKENVV
ncbi:Na+/H+ antiporter NhaA [Polaribacter sp. IC073]|uniref:Na+/H+ antiporter NhaA n=1 Tax=Polaribacter sp. IC073 TaxID=2508540 RepID=UPI0011BF4A5F|nr:Na+/H+ antiporter NhaA [Polaribacter sp. IC073]TXD47221.1 Na+/H+ antiporter NhaA [Polaribacter sp. IC073]